MMEMLCCNKRVGRIGGGSKSQGPSTKSQTSTKHEIPMFKTGGVSRFDHSHILHLILFVIWCL
jgi:hypothetical protein